MALVMVVAVVATATVLAYALLAVNTTQATLSENLTTAANSEYIAESGVNVAAYYLQWPSAVPASWTSTSGYKLYATAVPLNDGTTAAFDVKATADTTHDTYTIVSTGYLTSGSPLSRTVTATVTVNRVKIPAAGVFGGSITIPTHTTFTNAGASGVAAVQANGTVTNNGTITGTKLTSPLASGSYTAPTAVTANYYGVGTTGTYLWTDGVTLGTPQIISSNTLTALTLPTAAASNPAKIFYHVGNLTVTGVLPLTGTLIVRGGSITFSGVGTSFTVTPVGQYPAIICEKSATISGKSCTVTANGVAFLGTGFSWSGNNTGSKLAVNGALVMPSGTTIGTTSNGSISITYSATHIDVPNLAAFDQPGISVRTDSWSQ